MLQNQGWLSSFSKSVGVSQDKVVSLEVNIQFIFVGEKSVIFACIGSVEELKSEHW